MRGKATLIIALLTLAALAIPSVAAANWTHGYSELKSNASLTLKGNVTLSTSSGDIVCPAEIGTTLTGSSSSGHVNSFKVSKPSECDLTGSLAAICGTNGVTEVKPTGTWSLAVDEKDITISNIDIDYYFGSCLVSKLQVKGKTTASLSRPHSMGTVSLSGSQTLYNADEKENGTGELKGTLSASPGGTYGVKLPPDATWTHEGVPLEEEDYLELNGSFDIETTNKFYGVDGSLNMVLLMQPGDEGSIVGFHWSGCKGTGAMTGTTCTATGATAPGWTVKATYDGTFLVTFALHIYFWAGSHAGTPVATTAVSGNFIAAPDSPEAISWVELEAGEGFTFMGSPAQVRAELEVSPPETFGVSE